MTEALSRWLALREPADAAARSASLTRALARALPRRPPLKIVDLGSGRGSNVRYLTGYLPSPQRWLLVDRDAALLAEVPAAMSVAEHRDCEIETRRMDLGTLVPHVFFERDLVTASALLDLVSEAWLGSLAAHCTAIGAAVLFALTYDGRSQCAPAEPEDDAIRKLLNRHQRTNDHGFGPAAGPDAVDCAARCFASVGYEVRREASDWVLRADRHELQRQLIQGWADAAAEIAQDRVGWIENWLARRLAHVESGRSIVTVGHEDLAAWPASSRSRA
jgi:hypothetical protein